jgi:hypothetical protein
MLVVPVFVALKIGTIPAIGLRKASFIAIVIKETATPSALTGEVPEISELVASAAPAIKVAVVPVFATGAVIAKVFTSALVEASVQVEIPEVLDELQTP